jgi:hypothetical protein
MKTYAFRRIRESAKELGVWEIGLAVARNLEELFWTLDEFGNPFDFEYSPARPGDAVHAWQRDNRKAVAHDTGEMPEIDTCFGTDTRKRTRAFTYPTLAEPMQDQSRRTWTAVHRGMSPYGRKE